MITQHKRDVQVLYGLKPSLNVALYVTKNQIFFVSGCENESTRDNYYTFFRET